MLVLASAALPAAASASQLIARDAQGIRLAVDGHGRALLTYREPGRLRHVLAWGAVNASARQEPGGTCASASTTRAAGARGDATSGAGSRTRAGRTTARRSPGS